MSAERWVIRYHSRSTTNGKPVGRVYAQALRDAIPGYGADAWSYVYDPIAASSFATEHEALACAATKHWHEVEVLPLSKAAVIARDD